MNLEERKGSDGTATEQNGKELAKGEKPESKDKAGVKYQQITTITTSAPLFKYILSKHLEKYKYSRPEYLKDFYIASDLVCKLLIYPI